MIVERADLLSSKTIVLATTAMLAFAANSVLCRVALHQGTIDAASFGTLRLVSGAIVLAVILKLHSTRHPTQHPAQHPTQHPSQPPSQPPSRHPSQRSTAASDWLAAVMLFAYVAFFSFAYLALPTGTGALILFGAVQLTMIGAGLWSGERFGAVAWSGVFLAVAGFVYLMSPGIAAPPLLDAIWMAIAGIAWGVYSLRGRGVADPLAATAGNFARAAPLAVGLSLLLAANAHASPAGIALALTSGGLTSGVGYVIWYAALRQLSAMRAATLQLSVPLIAAFGGVVFLSEPITPRMAIAAATILGGIALVLARKSPARHPDAGQ